MLRHVFIGSLFFFSQSLIYCQQSDYIRGKVIDSKTSKPVSFAAVHLKNSGVAVYTNAEGDFRLLNNPGFQSDSVIVTCLGYHRRSVAYNVMKSSELNSLKLEPNIFVLREVSINARKRRLLSPDFIVARALNNLRKNSPSTPFSYVSYYRDYQKDSINYLNLNEAIIQTLDKGFANPTDSNRYRLLDFKKNLDFSRMDISPFYDIPETDHSDLWFKKIPYAMVGDQNGNELFTLLVHDAIRNFDKRSFSYIETLTHDFIRNHRFSTPDGIYDGSTTIYRINFTARKLITGDTIQAKGAIFIQPDDYSIHKLEYSVSFLNSEKRNNEIFNIEIEYGHELAVNSKMCLRYISFNNSFIIPDASDTNYFRIVKTNWRELGGPYIDPRWIDMTTVTFFNRKINPVSAGKMENYTMTVGKRTAKITRVKVDGPNLYLTVKDDRFTRKELDSCHLSINNLKDINGNILNRRKNLELHQYRELFVQQYNKPMVFQDNSYIQSVPLENNSISYSENSRRFWMNTPLKDKEKQQDSENATKDME